MRTNLTTFLILIFLGIDKLTKGHFEKKYDDENGWYFEQIKLQLLKNHRKDSENLEQGGVIPFVTNEHGLNPGLYLEMSLKHLNPINDYFFQRPCDGRKFGNQLHKSKSDEVYYINKKVGRCYVAKMMPRVIINLSYFFNCNGHIGITTVHSCINTCVLL